MRIELTGAETANQLIKQLAYLRLSARMILKHKDRLQRDRTKAEGLLSGFSGVPPAHEVLLRRIAEIDEDLLSWRFEIINIGFYLMPLCDALDRKAAREQVFDALGVGLADRDSDLVRKYGDKVIHLISVLDLENSATKDDDIDTRPLKWCHTMAFMNAMSTSDKLARTVHEGTREFFDGAFGEYREKPLMERLTGGVIGVRPDFA